MKLVATGLSSVRRRETLFESRLAFSSVIGLSVVAWELAATPEKGLGSDAWLASGHSRRSPWWSPPAARRAPPARSRARARSRSRSGLLLPSRFKPSPFPTWSASEPQAFAKVKSAGLTVVIARGFSTAQPKAYVYDQEPKAGNRIDQGSQMTIYVSEGPPP